MVHHWYIIVIFLIVFTMVSPPSLNKNIGKQYATMLKHGKTPLVKPMLSHRARLIYNWWTRSPGFTSCGHSEVAAMSTD